MSDVCHPSNPKPKRHSIRISLTDTQFLELKKLASDCDIKPKIFTEVLLSNLIRKSKGTHCLFEKITKWSFLMAFLVVFTPVAFGGFGYQCEYDHDVLKRDGIYKILVKYELINDAAERSWDLIAFDITFDRPSITKVWTMKNDLYLDPVPSGWRRVVYETPVWIYLSKADFQSCQSTFGKSILKKSKYPIFGHGITKFSNKVADIYRFRSKNRIYQVPQSLNGIALDKSDVQVAVREKDTYLGHAHYMDTVKNELLKDQWCYLSNEGDTLSISSNPSLETITLFDGPIAVTPPNQTNKFYPMDMNIQVSQPNGTPGAGNWGGEKFNDFVPLNTNPPDFWHCPDAAYYPALFDVCSGKDPFDGKREQSMSHLKNAMGDCLDLSEFNTAFDSYDLSGTWDSTINCGDGGYKLITQENNPDNPPLAIDRPFVYDKDGKCLNCGGEGWFYTKCYEKWKFHESPGCAAIWAVEAGTVAAMALGGGWLGPLIAPQGYAQTMIFAFRAMYNAGCIDFGYNTKIDDCNIAYGATPKPPSLTGTGFWSWVIGWNGLQSKEEWYHVDTIAQGADVANNAPEYTEKSSPEAWRTDIRLNFQEMRDSSDLGVAKDYIDLMKSHPEYAKLNKAVRKKGPMLIKPKEKTHEENLLDSILQRQGLAKDEIQYPNLEASPIDPSLNPQATYTNDDLDLDIGPMDLSDEQPGFFTDEAAKKKKLNSYNK